MREFVVFALEASGTLACITIIAAAVFRLTGAPLLLKILLPSVMLILAIATPWHLGILAGLPRPVVCADLPKRFDLLSFAPNDQTHRVYLWLRSTGEPRAYDVALSDDMVNKLLDFKTDLVREGQITLKISCTPPSESKPRGKLMANGYREDGETIMTAVPPDQKEPDE